MIVLPKDMRLNFDGRGYYTGFGGDELLFSITKDWYVDKYKDIAKNIDIVLNTLYKKSYLYLSIRQSFRENRSVETEKILYTIYKGETVASFSLNIFWGMRKLVDKIFSKSTHLQYFIYLQCEEESSKFIYDVTPTRYKGSCFDTCFQLEFIKSSKVNRIIFGKDSIGDYIWTLHLLFKINYLKDLVSIIRRYIEADIIFLCKKLENLLQKRYGAKT